MPAQDGKASDINGLAAEYAKAGGTEVSHFRTPVINKITSNQQNCLEGGGFLKESVNHPIPKTNQVITDSRSYKGFPFHPFLGEIRDRFHLTQQQSATLKRKHHLEFGFIKGRYVHSRCI